MPGGGDSESRSEANTTVTTTTNTRTTIGDIGVTGRNAVDLAAVLQAGVIESEEFRFQTLERINSLAETFAARNAALAETAIEAAGEDDVDPSRLVRLAPFALAAAVVLVPVIMRR